MTYKEATDYIFHSRPAFHIIGADAYKPGLENMLQLMKHLDNPHKQFKSIHIAGTNGKGSTSHLIASVLQSAGYKTGLYTSPHLVDFRERIKINGKMIDETKVADFIEKNMPLLEQLQPSFFETATALAFSFFAQEKVDIAVIETGLGGRLDATNIITPEVSIITNIGFDHTDFLGNTLEQIASEKAGIIKHKRPIVIGEHNELTDKVFNDIAAKENSNLYYAQDEDLLDATTPLSGIYQYKNRRTASCAIKCLQNRGWHINEQQFIEGFQNVIKQTSLRGRWEEHDIYKDTNTHIHIILDTGHNSHGISTFAQQLCNIENLHIVFGMVADKDVENVLSLFPQKANYYFTEPNTKRAIAAQDLKNIADKYKLNGKCFANVSEAISDAINLINKDATLFIGGSNYLVGEAIPQIDKLCVTMQSA